MLYQSFVAILLAPACLGISFNSRFAVFHDSDDCNDPNPHGETFDMSSDACIYQEGRKSFTPGNPADLAVDGGIYCFVYYWDGGDGNGECGCIKGARKIRTKFNEAPKCESKMVEGFKAYHFEPAKKGFCPVSGCYGNDTVVWEYKEQDSYLD